MNMFKLRPKALISVFLLVSLICPATYAQASSTSKKCANGDRNAPLFIKQKSLKVATNLSTNTQWPFLEAETNIIHKAIDGSHLKTGAKWRDIFVGGGTVKDKQGMIEEYITQSLLPQENVKIEAAANMKANELADNSFNAFNEIYSAPEGRSFGQYSYSQTPRSNSRSYFRSGSFKLEQRGFLGLMNGAGRMSYTISSKPGISFSPVKYSMQYNTCEADYKTGSYEYSTKVKVAPEVTINYTFTASKSKHRSFSGKVVIIDKTRMAEKNVMGFESLF